MVRFYPSEEIVKRFSHDFCLHFHGTVAAILQESDEAFDDPDSLFAIRQTIGQVFYQSIQRFSEAKELVEMAHTLRFAVNTMINLDYPEGTGGRDVKIVADLIPVEFACRLSTCYQEDEFLGTQYPTLQ